MHVFAVNAPYLANTFDDIISSLHLVEMTPSSYARPTTFHRHTTFTDLPFELRTLVYREVFTDNNAPVSVWVYQDDGAEKANVYQVSRNHNSLLGLSRSTFKGTCREVLHSNHQLREEALAHYYMNFFSNTTFDIGSSGNYIRS
jgi:hypothetical protein